MWLRTLMAFVVAGCTLIGQSRSDVDRLDRLLQELRGIDAQVWKARVAKLRARAAAEMERAVQLRKEAERLQKRAAAASARARSLERDVARQNELQALVRSLPPALRRPIAQPASRGTRPAAMTSRPVAKATAAGKPALKKHAPKKPAAKKPAAKKPAPKKPAPKKPAPKKPAPKKPAPKKPAAKKPAPKKPAPKKPAPKKPAPKKPAPKKPAPKKPAPKKPAPKKPAPKKPAPKKPALMKPAPKKPAPKKPAPKKPAPKKPAPKKPAPKKSGKAPVMKASVPLAKNFEDHVLPIIEEHCAGCHNPDDATGGLDLSTYDAALRGGSGGAVVKPGAADESRLYRLAAHLERPHMPPSQERIADAKLEVMRQWIASGAFADAAAAKDGATRRTAAVAKKAEGPRKPRYTGPPPMPKGLPRDVRAAEGRRPVPKALAASPRAPIVAVPGVKEIVLHNSDDLSVLGVLPFPHPDLGVLRFSADGSVLLAAGGTPGRKGRAVLYDVRTGKTLGSYGREFDTVLAAAVSPGLSLVAVGGASKKVRVYETDGGALAYEIKGHNDWVLALDVSPDGNFVASGDRAGGLRVTEADTGRNVHVLRGHRGAVHAVRFRPDGKALVSAGEDGTVRTWELEDGRQIRSTNAHRGKALALDWRADHLLATAGSDGQARLFKANGQDAGKLPALKDWVYAAAFDHSGKLLFTGAWNGRVQLFDVKKRKELPGFVAE